MTSLISFIVVFSIVTIAHELGHFTFARLAGIRVLEFGLGIGPKLFGFKANKTQYTLNLFPIGGFIRIAGLDEDEAESKEKIPASETYNDKSVFQKFASIFAGPLFNLLLAYVIFLIMFTFTGIPKGISNEIALISPGSEAQRVGILPGDKIITISGKKYANIIDGIKVIHDSAGKPVRIKIDRGGKVFTVTATPQLNEKMKVGLVGFSLKPVYEKIGFFSAIYQSLLQLFVISGFILYTVAMLIIGKISLLDLAGPVGIAQFTGQVAGEGIVPLLSFTAFLSINLGILNLLPIPALDGGRLVFIIIEKIRGKAMEQALENKMHAIGFSLLLGLMAFVTVNDLIRIFRK